MAMSKKKNAAAKKSAPEAAAAPAAAKQRELPSAVYEMGIGGGPQTTLQKILYPICVALLLAVCYNSFDTRELHFTRFRQGMYDLPPLDFRANQAPHRYYKPKKINLQHTEWKDGHDFCPTPW
jgi:hypothetical protein